MSKGFRTFLIDPFERTIKIIKYDGNWESIAPTIGCKEYCRARFNRLGENIAINDVGLYEENQKFFMMEG